MIIVYENNLSLTPHEIHDDNLTTLHEALWIDLINPSQGERTQVEQLLGLDIPTWEKMREIELSSRLYETDDALFMTATMVAQSESTHPKQDAVTFILHKQQLITVRYIDPQAFKFLISRLPKLPQTAQTPTSLLIELLDATTDRLADILEMVSHNLDTYSKTIFQSPALEKHDYHELMQQLGVNGDLNSHIGESLLSFNRLITFFSQSQHSQLDKKRQIRLSLISKDLTSLSEHITFLSNKIAFLLEATLGLINIEQNTIIKIFSVAAVIFLPPTLIASIYGMNFQHMPELASRYGYAGALCLMLISSWGTYKYFKYRKWL